MAEISYKHLRTLEFHSSLSLRVGPVHELELSELKPVVASGSEHNIPPGGEGGAGARCCAR